MTQANYRAHDRLRGIDQQYLSHQGNQQKVRRVRQRTRHLQPTIEQDFRIGVWLSAQPWIGDVAQGKVDREYARLSVLHHALCLAEDAGAPFGEVLNAVLDSLEREASAAIVTQVFGSAVPA